MNSEHEQGYDQEVKNDRRGIFDSVARRKGNAALDEERTGPKTEGGEDISPTP